jgi:hypothetical protein
MNTPEMCAYYAFEKLTFFKCAFKNNVFEVCLLGGYVVWTRSYCASISGVQDPVELR